MLVHRSGRLHQRGGVFFNFPVINFNFTPHSACKGGRKMPSRITISNHQAIQIIACIRFLKAPRLDSPALLERGAVRRTPDSFGGGEALPQQRHRPRHPILPPVFIHDDRLIDVGTHWLRFTLIGAIPRGGGVVDELTPAVIDFKLQ